MNEPVSEGKVARIYFFSWSFLPSSLNSFLPCFIPSLPISLSFTPAFTHALSSSFFLVFSPPCAFLYASFSSSCQTFSVSSLFLHFALLPPSVFASQEREYVLRSVLSVRKRDRGRDNQGGAAAGGRHTDSEEEKD